MAVDTRDRRFSMLGFGQAFGWPVVFPNVDGNNAEDVFERAQWLYLYAGISIQSGQPTIRRWGGVPWVVNGNPPIVGRTW